MSTRQITVALGCFLAVAAPLAAQAPPSETDRLVATAKLWIAVHYFHPYLAYRDIDWDHALVEALPKIRAASSQAEYQAAINSMVSALKDAGPSAEVFKTQRALVYHGLPAEDGSSREFYSAFLTKSNEAEEWLSVPMGGFAATVRLSESPPTEAFPTPHPKTADTEPFPSTELRILSAYKIWGAFHYFFAYRDLMDDDWDALLPIYLERVISAKNANEYHLAIAEWLTHTTDSLVQAQSSTLTEYFGEAPVGLRMQVVEKHVTITDVLDPAATAAGIKPGDIVKKLGNETILDRFKRLAQYVPASTTQRLGVDVIDLILNGPEGSSAMLTIEDPLGNRKDVALTRSKKFAAAQPASPEPARLLAGKVGYLDLTRLTLSQSLAALESYAASPAVIFDMRGKPTSLTASDLAQLAGRLTGEHDLSATIVTGPWVITPDLPRSNFNNPSSSYFFFQTINSASQLYTGKTVMLIDERTIDTGELAGLFFQAANTTELVGSLSAGAHSTRTSFTVPGGITIWFSGQDIRQANGGKLQRLGLQPNVAAAPTAKGIRAGRDEVLEKALNHLTPAKNPAPVRPAE